LYLIAISILFYKGTDLSLNKVTTINKGDTVISITEMPPKPDASETKIKKVILDSLMKNPFIDSTKYTVVEKKTIEDKDAKIAERKNWVPPNNKRDRTTDSKEIDQTVDDPYGKREKK
jgi:hypothetical protein